MKPIYLDHHATTPVDAAVFDAMAPYFSEKFGNASSRSHVYGSEAEAGVDEARASVAGLIGAAPQDIIFTSGATESINLAIQGVAAFYRNRGNHIITVQTEHRAVLDCCKSLEQKGCNVTYIPVDKDGMIDVNDVESAMTGKTILVTIMYANHEIGVIHDIKAIGKIARSRNVFFHCDASQAIGSEEIDVEKLGVDLLSLSAHKIYGPKGVGALYVRRKNPRVRLAPLLHGGGHERGHRSGTLNVPGIVGLGKACDIIKNSRAKEQKRVARLRDMLKTALENGLDGLAFNGHQTQRLAGNLNVSFSGIDGRALLTQLGDHLAVSAGASCSSAIPEPSYILKAISVPYELAQATIRVGVGRYTTEDEIRIAGEYIIKAVHKLRKAGAKTKARLACSGGNHGQ